MQIPPADAPIVCGVSAAPDSSAERMAEYRTLFATVLIGRERLADETVRFRLRADDGVEAQVRDLAARERACCAFMSFDVTVVVTAHSAERPAPKRTSLPSIDPVD